MRNSNENGYMPYNEETYDFGTYSSIMRRLKTIRNFLAAADALYITVCLILVIVAFGSVGFASFIYLIRAVIMAAVVVTGTMFRLDRKKLFISVAGVVLAILISFALGLLNVYSVIMLAMILVSAVLYTYLGICEQPLAEKPGYPYFNELSYEASARKEYIPDHKLYERRGTSMDGISLDDADAVLASENNQKSGIMEEISPDSDNNR